MGAKGDLVTYFKADDKFIEKLEQYITDKGLTFNEFCEINSLPLYITQKVFDKKIKMAIQPSFLVKVAKIINVSRGTLLGQQPIGTHGKDYKDRKIVRF